MNINHKYSLCSVPFSSRRVMRGKLPCYLNLRIKLLYLFYFLVSVFIKLPRQANQQVTTLCKSLLPILYQWNHAPCMVLFYHNENFLCLETFLNSFLVHLQIPWMFLYSVANSSSTIYTKTYITQRRCYIPHKSLAIL